MFRYSISQFLILSLPAPAALCGPADILRDHRGDPLPPGAVARLGTVRLRHPGSVTALAFSPDGKWLASTSHNAIFQPDRTLRVWDARTGKELRRLDVETDWHWFSSVAFSPDGKNVAAGSERGPIRLWDVESGKKIRDFLGNGSPVTSLAFTPDGKCLMSSARRDGIRLWDANTGKKIKDLSGRFVSGAFSFDGKTLAAVGLDDQLIHLWDRTSGRNWRLLNDKAKQAWAEQNTWAALSSDGKALALIRRDGLIRLLDSITGNEVRQLQNPKDCRAGLAFSPDGRYLAAGVDETVCVWEVASGSALPPIRLPRKRGESKTFAFFPDSKILAAADGNGVIHFWELATGKDVSPVAEEPIEARSLTFSADGTMFSMRSGVRSIHRWKTTSWSKHSSLRVPVSRVYEEHVILAPSPDGRTAAFNAYENEIHLYDQTTGHEWMTLHGHSSPPEGLRFSTDGKLVASWSGGRTRLWEVATGRQRSNFEFYEGAETAFSPDGKVLVTGRFPLRFRDSATGRQLHPFEIPGGRLPAVWALSADFRNYAMAENEETQIWDVQSRKKILRLQEEEEDEEVTALAFSPDRRMLAAAYGRRSARSATRPNPPRDSQDEKKDFIRVWELATGKMRRRLRGHEGTIRELAFSPDGRLLASASWDATALVWDMSGQALASPRPVPQTAENWAKVWAELAGDDAARAFEAIGVLTTQPHEAMPRLRQWIRPMRKPDPRRLARWIADLDSESFEVRQQASRELEQRGELVEKDLKKALTVRPTLEMRRRLELLLDPLAHATTPEQRRRIRAIEALERIGSADARRLLEELAGGAADAVQTHEAKASLERLSQRFTAPPSD